MRVLLEDADIEWKVRPAETEMFIKLWETGEPIQNIAEALKRSDLEIALLAIDQSLAGSIQTRKSGIFGG
ncbi:hypothetical protein [Sporosarcina cyprini]|uniref:hypothetical protein n=1 Tax=Sporosarcina cyprini TaxID=2910523 RepID=UPI001EE12DB4|nr:hypothetical protein [Sporosarcina cyprini]MCG3089158.1 hypothetical protein [Sporosarcina cyprini]